MAVSNDSDFREWLEAQTKDVCVAISFRSAMRAIPFASLVDDKDPLHARHVLGACRSLITAGVAALRPSEMLEKAADSASRRPFDPTIESKFSYYALAVDRAAAAASRAAAAGHKAKTVSATRIAVRAAARAASLLDDSDAYFETDAASDVSALMHAKNVTNSAGARASEGGEILRSGHPWTFWAEWYDRAMAGDPVPWELQERIALIPDAVWEAGPEAVADEIARIRARYELGVSIEAVEADNRWFQAHPPGPGHNNPPVEIDDPVVAQHLTIVWATIDDLKIENEKAHPEPARFEALVTQLRVAFHAVLSWLGGRMTLTVDTVIKWGVPAAGGGYVFLYPDKVEAVLRAAQAVLPFLGP